MATKADVLAAIESVRPDDGVIVYSVAERRVLAFRPATRPVEGKSACLILLDNPARGPQEPVAVNSGDNPGESA